jgi:hypothetical protein
LSEALKEMGKLFLLLVGRSFGKSLLCSASVLPRQLATCLAQAGMAVHASEASTDLDEPGDKEIVLKNSGRNLSQFRLIMLKVKLCFWGNNSSFCTSENTLCIG